MQFDDYLKEFLINSNNLFAIPELLDYCGNNFLTHYTVKDALNDFMFFLNDRVFTLLSFDFLNIPKSEIVNNHNAFSTGINLMFGFPCCSMANNQSVKFFRKTGIFSGITVSTSFMEGMLFDYLFDFKVFAIKGVDNKCILSNVFSQKIDFFSDNPDVFNNIESLCLKILLDNYGYYFIILLDYVFYCGDLAYKFVHYPFPSVFAGPWMNSILDQSNKPVDFLCLRDKPGFRLRHIVAHGLVSDAHLPLQNVAVLLLLCLYSLSPEEIKEYTKDFNNEITSNGSLKINVFNTLQ